MVGNKTSPPNYAHKHNFFFKNKIIIIKGSRNSPSIGDGGPNDTHKHRKKTKAEKRGVKTPFLLAMVGLVVPRSIKKKTKKGSQSSPLCWQWQAYLCLEAQRKKKGKKGEPKFCCYRWWWKAKLPRLHWHWQAQLRLEAWKKKTKIGESKLPHYWQSSLDHLRPKTKKKKNGCMLTLE